MNERVKSGSENKPDITEHMPEIIEIQRRGIESFAGIAKSIRSALQSGIKPERVSERVFASMLNHKERIVNSLRPSDEKGHDDAWDVHMYLLKQGKEEQVTMVVDGPNGSVSLPGASPEMFIEGEGLIDFLRINRYRRESVRIIDFYFGYIPSQAEKDDGAKKIKADPQKAEKILKEILVQFPLPKK